VGDGPAPEQGVRLDTRPRSVGRFQLREDRHPRTFACASSTAWVGFLEAAWLDDSAQAHDLSPYQATVWHGTGT
jgi:hypothetical protein